MTHLYKTYMKSATDQHECPLCERSFTSQEETDFLTSVSFPWWVMLCLCWVEPMVGHDIDFWARSARS
jgi:hypothetical protein